MRWSSLIAVRTAATNVDAASEVFVRVVVVVGSALVLWPELPEHAEAATATDTNSAQAGISGLPLTSVPHIRPW